MTQVILANRSAASGMPLLQRLAAPVRSLVCAPVCAKKGKQANVKVSKRGKVSSRPGPGWQPPAQPATPLAADQQQQQQQPQQTDMQASTASSTSVAAAAPQQQQQPPPYMQRSAPSAETPQVVVDRMLKRVITCAGVPVLTGMLLFPLFWYLRVVQKVEYPIWVVYVTQAFMFGGGLLGISYGILSTSWDPRREGSALGWTELQANLPILLNRNKGPE